MNMHNNMYVLVHLNIKLNNLECYIAVIYVCNVLHMCITSTILTRMNQWFIIRFIPNAAVARANHFAPTVLLAWFGDTCIWT